MARGVVLIFEPQLTKEFLVSCEEAQARSREMERKGILLNNFQLQFSNVDCSIAIESSPNLVLLRILCEIS